MMGVLKVVFTIIVGTIICMIDACVTLGELEREPDERAPRPQGCTNMKLRQLARAVGAHYDAEVGASGLKGTQYSLLSHIVKMGPLRPVALARTMKLAPSTLSRNLQPLIDAGWVTTCAGDDARGHQVVATEAGAALRADAQRRWLVAQHTINQRLGVDNVVALHALLDTCLALLDASPHASKNSQDNDLERHD